MKFAYYEENKYHTEIIGLLLEYIIYINSNTNKLIELTVYNDKDYSNTLNYFKNKYKFKIKNNNSINTDFDEYNYIFIGTSNAINKINQDIITHNNNKIIYICHLKEDIMNSFNNIIVLTPLNNLKNNKIHYILPIHNFLNYKENDYRINKNNRIVITGRFKDNHRDVNDLINFINNNNNNNIDFEIIICSRLEKFVPNELYELSKINPSHLKIFIGLNSTELEKIIMSSKYICPLVSSGSWYFNDRFTGSIALSYNYNKPLIIQNKLRDIYGIKNCLSYENTLTETIDKITNISDSEYINIIKDLYTEKLEIINRNNKTLDGILC
jgi:hypothetical protein